MEHLMPRTLRSSLRVLFQSVLGATLLSLAIGCSSTDSETKQETRVVIPERPVEVVFKNMSTVQVKNNLMSACSQSRLRVVPDRDEVVCIRHNLDSRREQMLLTLINDDYARNMTDNIKFVLTPEERDVRVVGNAYVQFASPLGIEIDAGVKITRVNLRDNESFSMLDAVAKQASDMKP